MPVNRLDAPSFIILLLIAIPAILIWQHQAFPLYIVVLGTLICGVLLFFWLRKIVRSKR
ncbi:hypothetical protein LX64_02572 [Chitinophaga skermanii]|uniref:Uncharacterized protein n=1 Tax=Chitinophaga skermanii TaxID=331697 RepID=A0A327QNZ2_9BACT|nr:hypothetical protein [Chitinophaga skermanii]RAJ05414.1 hypothetical protein LX64_02572 [Chitinophaga skermanii]